jgi:hypothetical protein
MRLRSRNAIAMAIAALVLIGAGAALAQSQSPSPSTSPAGKGRKAVTAGAFLDVLARRLGIARAKLDSAFKAMALDEVKWQEDNGFISATEADLIRQRINSGRDDALGRFPGLGHHGFGIGGFGGLGVPPGLGRGGPLFKDRLGGGRGLLSAAAGYIGLTEANLVEALQSKTLAQIARDHSKSLVGLKSALRSAEKAKLDSAVTNFVITSGQENALLARFDARVGGLVNGIPPGVSDLARQLGIDQARLITAIKNTAVELVDQALARGEITKAQADALKQRIRSSAAWPLGSDFGPCGGPGRFGPGRGGFKFRGGFPFKAPNPDEDVVGL